MSSRDGKKDIIRGRKGELWQANNTFGNTLRSPSCSRLVPHIFHVVFCHGVCALLLNGILILDLCKTIVLRLCPAATGLSMSLLASIHALCHSMTQVCTTCHSVLRRRLSQSIVDVK